MVPAFAAADGEDRHTWRASSDGIWPEAHAPTVSPLRIATMNVCTAATVGLGLGEGAAAGDGDGRASGRDGVSSPHPAARTAARAAAR
jgi:hypothetical protein